MKERVVAVQFKDLTGETAVARADRPPLAQRDKFRVIYPSQRGEADSISGVIGKQQTGTNTLRDIEQTLACIREEYKKGERNHAELHDEKKFLLASRRRIVFIQSKGD